MKIKLLLLAGSLLSLAAPAFGDTLSFSGTTAGTSMFNRPTEAGDSLSDVGSSVPYWMQPFSVSQSGSYSFSTVANAPANFDTFVHLYSVAFNPAAPLANLVRANDDLLTGNSDAGSGFASQSLTSGTPYFYVVDGIGNSDFGNFTGSITGPGAISTVPEPSVYALAGLGISALIFLKRRKISAA